MRGRGVPRRVPPRFPVELAKGSARRSRVEWPTEGSDRYGGQLGWAKKDKSPTAFATEWEHALMPISILRRNRIRLTLAGKPLATSP